MDLTISVSNMELVSFLAAAPTTGSGSGSGSGSSPSPTANEPPVVTMYDAYSSTTMSAEVSSVVVISQYTAEITVAVPEMSCASCGGVLTEPIIQYNGGDWLHECFGYFHA